MWAITFYRTGLLKIVYQDLGKAGVSHNSPFVTEEEGITYRSQALYAGYLFREPTKTWNVFAKLGVGVIQNGVTNETVSFEEQSAAFR